MSFFKRGFSKISIILLGLVMFSFSSLSASEEHADSTHEEKFNAGKMILDHVLDAHDWHIMTIGEHHVSIPLPIIIYDRVSGEFKVFSSAKFAHGHSHDGYAMPHEGKFAGKIVRLKEGTEEVDETAQQPLDFSITKTVLGIFFSAMLLIIIFGSIAKSYKRRADQAPKGIQSLLEPLILFVRDDIARSAIGEKKFMKYTPFLLTIFFFIFFNNLLGLIPIFPGGANVTGNIAVTMVLAVFTFIITTLSANKAYWVHIVNTPGVPWWLKFPLPLMPIVEIMGVFTKPFVLMVRLFANILAGHIVILGFMSMIFIFGAINAYMGYGVSIISVAFSLFLSMLELLVAFIQAYVFTLLSALYFGMAIEEHHEEHH